MCFSVLQEYVAANANKQLRSQETYQGRKSEASTLSMMKGFNIVFVTPVTGNMSNGWSITFLEVRCET